MQELISRTTHPDHYQQMKDRQQALSNGPQPGLLNLRDALDQVAYNTNSNKKVSVNNIYFIDVTHAI